MLLTIFFDGINKSFHGWSTQCGMLKRCHFCCCAALIYTKGMMVAFNASFWDVGVNEGVISITLVEDKVVSDIVVVIVTTNARWCRYW